MGETIGKISFGFLCSLFPPHLHGTKYPLPIEKMVTCPCNLEGHYLANDNSASLMMGHRLMNLSTSDLSDRRRTFLYGFCVMILPMGVIGGWGG